MAWLHRPPDYDQPVLVTHPEHIADRMRDGWTECADPTAAPVVAPAPVNAAPPRLTPQQQQQQRKGRR